MSLISLEVERLFGFSDDYTTSMMCLGIVP